MSALIELEKAYRKAWRDRSLPSGLDGLLKNYAGRPTPLYFAERLTEKAGGPGSTSSGRTSPTPGRTRSTTRWGRGLLARRMGKRRIIAETGAGQHGVATATVCARMGIPCEIYMGKRTSGGSPTTSSGCVCSSPSQPGDLGEPDAEGRHERGASRLGDERPDHLLPDRVHGKAAPVPGDGPGLPVGDRAGSAAPVPEGGRETATAVVACVGGSNAMGIFTSLPAVSPGAALRGGGGRSRSLFRETRGHALPREGRRAPRGANRSSCKTRTDRSSKPTRSPRGWTTPGWVRARVAERDRQGEVRLRDGRAGALRILPALTVRGSSRRSSRPTPSRSRTAWRKRCGRPRPSW